MVLTDRITTFSRDNVWILAAVFFFIVWKFFLIGTLWNDRFIPPVPDDSYVYILHLDGTINCQNLISCDDRAINLSTYAGFDHLTYRLFVGVPAKIIGLSPVEAYQFGFYLGTVGLLFVLLFFLSSLGINSKKFLAFSLFIFSLYNGAGSFHGLYWVVPSYFAFGAFLITLSLLLRSDQKRWMMWMTLSVPLGIYSHILGLYLLALFPLIALFRLIYERSLPILLIKKILFAFCLAAITYIPVAFHYSQISDGNPYGPEKALSSIISQQNTNTQEINHARIGAFSHQGPFSWNAIFPGWRKINDNYIRWIFPSWIGYIIFMTCIGILLYFKQYRILSVYFSAFIFTLATSINIHGERSLIFLWPITYLLYGQSAWFAWKAFATPHIPIWTKMVGRLILIIVTLFFILLSITYSFLWNQYLNQARNIDIRSGVTEYLHQNLSSKERVVYSEDMSLLGNMLYIKYGANRPRHTVNLLEAKYYITLNNQKKIDDTTSYNSIFKFFFSVITKTLLFDRQREPENNYQILPKNESVIFQKEAIFGDVEVYRILQKNN